MRASVFHFFIAFLPVQLSTGICDSFFALNKLQPPHSWWLVALLFFLFILHSLAGFKIVRRRRKWHFFCLENFWPTSKQNGMWFMDLNSFFFFFWKYNALTFPHIFVRLVQLLVSAMVLTQINLVCDAKEARHTHTCTQKKQPNDIEKTLFALSSHRHHHHYCIMAPSTRIPFKSLLFIIITSTLNK